MKYTTKGHVGVDEDYIDEIVMIGKVENYIQLSKTIYGKNYVSFSENLNSYKTKDPKFYAGVISYIEEHPDCGMKYIVSIGE